MHKKNIDINCDMGESYGQFIIGNDDLVFPYITSCNIACGFHGGDAWHIEKTVKKALQHNVRIGAHPSYPDLSGFGRRKMQVPQDELRAIIKYQIAAVRGIVESLGGKLEYVKPHGALYNTAAEERETALAVVFAIKEMGGKLALMGLSGSLMAEVAAEHGAAFIAEAFADRRYGDNGKLLSRKSENAVLHDPAAAVEQVISIIGKNTVISESGVETPVHAQSICVHGDNPNCVDILQALNAVLLKKNIKKSWQKK